jgi:hypothetical protein
MRKIAFYLFLILSSLSYAQGVELAQPETITFYKGYENKVVPMGPCGEEIELSVIGGTCEKSTWSEDGIIHKGFLIVPNESVNSITIAIFSKRNNGTGKSYGNFKYNVKELPKANILTKSVSKTIGAKIDLAFGSNTMLNNVSINIKGGIIQVGTLAIKFTGNQIPASLVSSSKIGEKLGIKVDYTIGNGEKTYTTSADIIVIQ